MIKKFNLKLIVFLIACLYSAMLSAQINTPSGAVVPFNSNPNYGGNGIMPTNLPTTGTYGKSQDAADAYNEWKAAYTETCTGDMIRIKFDEPNRTVSEGIAYGMQLAAYAADKALFDGLYKYWKNFQSPNSSGKAGKLMNWRINGCSGVSGTGSAADADVDAAWALMIAETQWPNLNTPYDYITEANNMLNAIKELEMLNGQLINGDGWGFADQCRNPSYQSPAYYEYFKVVNAGNSGTWNGGITGAYNLINANADVTTGLISDWSNPSGVRNTCNPGGLGQAATDGYGYDACRNPWRMAQDVIWNNNANAKTICGKITDKYINVKGPGGVGGPLYQNGNNYAGFSHNATFVSTFAMAVMGSTNQALMNSMYTETKNTKDVIKNSTLSGYFGNTLRCVSLFMMTGNFWKYGTTSFQDINVRRGTTTVSVLSGTTYDFQTQQINTGGKVGNFTIENLGFASLTLSGSPIVVLSGTNAADFILTQPTATSLALSQTTTFTVTFKPTTVGDKTAKLTIASNDPDEASYVINLTGTGTLNATAPKMSVFDASTGAAVTNNGTVSMGTASAGSANLKRFGIVNTGDAALNIPPTGTVGYTVTGTGYSLVTTTPGAVAPTIVAIGDTGYVYVEATSLTAANLSGSLTIISDDNINPSFKINLTSAFVACATAVTTNDVYQDYNANAKNSTAGTISGFTESVDNLYISEKNPSTKVGRLVRNTSEYQGPRYTLCGSTVNLTATKFAISMLVYSPAAGIPIKMGLKTDADVADLSYPERSGVIVTTTKANQWERLYFYHSGAIGVTGIRHIEIYINPTAPISAGTYYIDDIRLESSPCLTDNSGIIQDFNDHNNVTLSYPVAGYEPGAVNDKAVGLNTSTNIGKFTKSAATLAYKDGIRYIGCGGKFDISTKKYVSMLVYSTVANAKINMSPKIGANDALVSAPSTVTVFANQWHRIYFDLSAVSATDIPNITGIDIFFDPLNDLGAQTYRFDDIRFESALPCIAGIDATEILNDFENNRFLGVAFPGETPVTGEVTYFNTVSANPSATGANTSTVVGKFLRGTASTGTSFRFTACQSKLSLTPGRAIIDLKMYSPNANVAVVMSLKNAAGVSLSDVTDTIKLANTWTNLRFDHSKLLNSTEIAFIDIIVDGAVIYSGTSSTATARTYYVDDLRYSLPAPEINIQANTTPALTDIPTRGAFNMGTASIGDSTTMDFKIQNNGLETLTLTGTGAAALVIGGANPADFIISTTQSFSTSISGLSVTGFTVKFKPTAGGARSASITIVSNDANESPYIIYLTGTGTVPVVSVLNGGTTTSTVIPNNNPTAINVGTSAVGTPATPAYTFSIKNTGVGPLTVKSITASSTSLFTVSTLSSSTPILTGAIATFTVTGTPAATGLNTGFLTIVTNDPATPSYKVNITVTGSVPVISVSDATPAVVINNNTTPVSVGFAPVNTDAAAYTFTINNTGSAPLTITSISGLPTTVFAISGVPATAIAAGGSATFKVTGKPAAAGVNTGSITIVTNDPVTPSYKVNVTVTGTVPVISVSDATPAVVVNNNTTPVSVGSAPVNTDAPIYTFTINNTGLAPLTITSISGLPTTVFAISGIPATPIAAGGSATFKVTGKPAAAGVNTGSITIVTNDPVTGSYKVNVSVTGTVPALQVLNSATAVTSDNAPAISVGSSTVGTSAAAYTAFSVKNAGLAPLTFTSITSSSADFVISAVTPATPASIAAGNSATFTVTAKPAVVGANTAVITIVTNDPTNPTFKLNVSVTGIAASTPSVQVLNGASIVTDNSTAILVGTAPVNTTAAPFTTFSIKNNGTAALDFTSITSSSADFVISAVTPAAPTSLAIGASATFTVTAKPMVLGTGNTAVITIVTNDPTTASFKLNVTATGTAPAIQVFDGAGTTTQITSDNVTAISLGTATVTEAATPSHTFTIKNNGTAPLTGLALTATAGFEVSALTPAGTSLAPNATATFTVTGTPALVGANTGSITIASNDGTTPAFKINVSVTGTAAPAKLQVVDGTSILTSNGTAISLGTAVVGSAVPDYTTISIKNTGGSPLTFTSITSSSAVFVLADVTPAAPGTIAAGASATFTIKATPVLGANTGKITIVTNDATTPSFVINVSATGTSNPVPAVQVLDGSTQLVTNGTAVSLGTAPVGTDAPAYTTLSIKNNGTAPLSFTSITSSSAQFVITDVSPAAPTTLAVGASATFTVTAKPLVVGTANTAKLTIVTDDPATASFVVNVSVTGTPAPLPSLQVLNGSAIVTNNNATPISLGTAAVGSPAPAYTSLSIKNNGSAPLTFTSITSSSAQFVVSGVTPEAPTTLAVGASATFTVTATPLAVGTGNTAKLTIVTNDPATPSFDVNVAVTGTPAPKPIITVTGVTNNGSTVSIGNVTENTATAPYTFTISNTGSLPLEVGSITSSNPVFVVTQVNPTTIAPNSTGTFTVIGTPTSVGTVTGKITIPSNDISTPSFVINVSVTGKTAPSGAILEILNKSAIVMVNDGTPMMIGANSINTVTAPYQFTLTNPGTVAVNIGGITATTGFIATQMNPTGTTLAPGAIATFTVRGTPNSVGTPRQGSVIIKSNNAAGGDFILNVSVEVGTPTGVASALAATEIDLFPNPSTGSTNLEFNGSFNEVAVTIYTIDGNKVFASEYASVDPGALRTLNVEELPSGIYIVEVSTAEGKLVKRLIKQ
ncbi:glycosyl hydrolase family 8 [Cytophaga hutchinsonii]|uniref:cellulase n=1 Tax=Cytophaga hutchinsonii (strain ATCC 33406 / DSM 1761 / CIP 103989 / NBRC 15051 / NCIMB 9469 / D465) TaxID=269798 RepID=A0A6N4SPX0_CYTH3|nr:glycosyl hydrolase family 8 [Cytophaga hutchinsonii]ABG58352.1 CHU large protein; candidate b-glycosidase, glycoside hydrolase family 8 protein [Cytophaga hutchinsonii ATCC 33406]SFX51966.1 Por secretion system C-terminal sorting domain-containing protein [Cytophaga hutchinsonii ATCC 33406]